MGGGNRGNLQTENRWLCFLQKYVSSWPLNSHGLDGARCGATGDFPRRRGEVLHALPAECIPAARPAGRGASQAERMLMSGLEDRFARNIPGSFTPRTPQWHLQPLAFDRRGAPGKSACPRTDCILEGGAEREECSPRIAAIYFWETSEGPGLGCARLSRDCSGRPSPARGRRDSRRPPVPHVRASSSKQSGNQRCGGQGFERGDGRADPIPAVPIVQARAARCSGRAYPRDRAGAILICARISRGGQGTGRAKGQAACAFVALPRRETPPSRAPSRN
jgi:hypothetical protein